LVLIDTGQWQKVTLVEKVSNWKLAGGSQEFAFGNLERETLAGESDHEGGVAAGIVVD